MLVKRASVSHLGGMGWRRAVLFWVGLGLAVPGGARAEAIWLRGAYEVSLAGLTGGRGGWEVRLTDDGFAASGHGRTTGILRLFSSGKGEARASGGIREGRPVGERYDYLSTKSEKFDEISLRLRDGAVTEWKAEPPSRPRKTRVALEDAHRIGVVDPISGVLMPVRSSADTVGPAACARVIPVFDGRMRYDLVLSFKRMETVKSGHGYRGPAVVCAIRFNPIAGHVPDRPAIKYLTGLQTMEVWLAPVGGLPLVVPWRVMIPTPFGTAKLEAERFEVGLE